MNPVLLDAGGAGLIFLLFALGLIFMIVTVLLEAGIMRSMKYHLRFQRALLDSLVANLLSLSAGFALLRIDSHYFDLYNPVGFIFLFLATLVVELIVLYLMNRAKPLIQTLKVCTIMNVVTYLIILVLVLIFN